MTYEDALDFIHGTLKFGSKLGLTNIRTLLEYMGNPQKKLKFIHIAGTNGKGSTSAFLASILKEEGYKVGLFISPFIEAFTERIVINHNQISREDLARITEDVKKHISKMVQDGHLHPTEFEVVTAIGFQYFYEQQCDVVVLEVGLGGRLDATNVIDTPLVSVITSISMDHTEYLGETIEKIAFEKCGIIKDRSITVTYPEQQAGALKVIQETVGNKQGQLIIPELQYEILYNTLDGIVFNYKRYEAIEIHLLGLHQVLNAITAISVVEVLNQHSLLRVSDRSLRNGLSHAKWIGRLEVIAKQPYIIIDGAHNYSGIQALSNAIDTYFKDKQLIFLLGMLKDKEYEKMLDVVGYKAHTIVTTTPNNPRALSANVLGEVAKNYCKHVIIEDNIENALRETLTLANADNIILCFGSLYLIGDIRRSILK
jgi:dihydrofolate synthase/folylpolyglutamate synthase